MEARSQRAKQLVGNKVGNKERNHERRQSENLVLLITAGTRQAGTQLELSLTSICCLGPHSGWESQKRRQ